MLRRTLTHAPRIFRSNIRNLSNEKISSKIKAEFAEIFATGLLPPYCVTNSNIPHEMATFNYSIKTQKYVGDYVISWNTQPSIASLNLVKTILDENLFFSRLSLKHKCYGLSQLKLFMVKDALGRNLENHLTIPAFSSVNLEVLQKYSQGKSLNMHATVKNAIKEYLKAHMDINDHALRFSVNFLPNLQIEVLQDFADILHSIQELGLSISVQPASKLFGLIISPSVIKIGNSPTEVLQKIEAYKQSQMTILREKRVN